MTAMRRRPEELAAALGRETAPFEVDVRKLKQLGLTISHDVGYQLSPRGKAVLTRLRRAERTGVSRRPDRRLDLGGMLAAVRGGFPSPGASGIPEGERQGQSGAGLITTFA